MILVFSTSLHPESKSRLLANAALDELKSFGESCEMIDLAYMNPLPPCNGHDCFGDPGVGELANKITTASGILIAAPVYNFDVSASCKNLIELTGSAWNDKVVGLLCAAGGQGSYMSPISLANSLMLDFRCLILPRFVFATEQSFPDGQLADDDISVRIRELARQMVKVSKALK